MIHLWSCDRRRFVEFLSDRNPLSGVALRTVKSLDGIVVRRGEIVLVWHESPAGAFALPRAVIVSEDKLTDFLAWVSTYLRHIRPFTAHCRVLTPSTVLLCEQTSASTSAPDIGSADVGLTIAEGISYAVGRANPGRLSFAAFARTVSYAFADALKQYGQMQVKEGNVFERIRTGWQSARELSNQALLNLSPVSIRDVWHVVLSACGDDAAAQVTHGAEPLLVEAVRGVRENGRVPVGAWKRLTDRVTKSGSLLDTLDGPREARVNAVERALRELVQGSDVSRRERAFVAGYMASRIQTGSLDHLPVLFPFLGELRESLLWYGACAGLAPISSVDAYANGLGWLMKRELGRLSHWLERPNCDIALSEMSILLANRQGAKPNIPTVASGVLKVELVPLVSTNITWSEHGEDQFGDKGSVVRHPRTLFDEEALMREDVLDLLRRIGDSARSLDAIRKLAENVLGEKPSKSRHRKK